ncbi:MAG: STAS domain-containing protein [Peptococcaceae bacterium]|nr:MAG: STAS domain-containing protein [Peptococcaceae bacterium]
MERVPILKMGDTLILTLQLELHDEMAFRLQEDILKKIYETRARGLVIDVSAVSLVDSFMGRMISDTAIMARTMGVESVLVGVQPDIAITLQEMGLELKGVHTALNLEKGLALLQNMGEVGHEED